MKNLNLLFAFAVFFISVALIAQEDVIVLEGGVANGGIIETTINNEVAGGVNKVYELKRGQFYMMHSAIDIDNPGGTLTIRAEAGDGPKPVILRVPVNEIPVGNNLVEGSLVLQGIQYHWKQTDGAFGGDWRNWSISGDNSKLVVEDCLFEYCSGDLFNADEVESGFVAIFRNNYFRDFHGANQWWAGRVLTCKVPVDTLIYENNTTTGAGLTILGHNCLFDYTVINHNTFVNNTKYPFLNVYYKTLYMTNNLFVNANWVGEDRENVATGGQDPDALLTGLVGLDTIHAGIKIQSKYLNSEGTALTEEVDEISDYIWYAADNVCVASATLDNYYSGGMNSVFDDAPASYLDWNGLGNGPWRVVNVPGIFMNERTEAIIADHDNIIAENNIVFEMTAEELGFGTDPLPQAAADVYARWNQAKWGVPGVNTPDIGVTYFGDYDANTLPGVETENSYAGGITKISDMIEDFSYSANLISKSDGLPIGALHWDDITFDSEASLLAVTKAYGDTMSNITFRVNVNEVPDLVEDGFVWLSFGSQESRYILTDVGEDGLYALTLRADIGSELEYIFSYQNGPDTTINVVAENLPEDCSNASGLRTLHVPVSDLTLPAFYFDSCLAATVMVSNIVVWVDGVATVKVRSELQMKETLLPSDASDKTVSWSVDDPEIATIDGESGLLTGVKAGEVTVIATANDGSGISGSLSVVVTNLVEAMEINGNVIGTKLNIGSALELRVDIAPSDAADKSVSWSVDDPTIAAINDTLGILTGLKAGNVIVTATANDGSGVTATLAVTVLSNDASLSDLTADTGILTPVFDPDVLTYYLEVPAGTTSITLTATANHGEATVNGQGVVEISSEVTITSVEITAEDGSVLIYQIAIHVVPTSVAVQVKSELGFYPNPASDRIHLKGNAIANIRIFTAGGKLVVFEKNVSSVSVKDLAKGSYIIELTMGEDVTVGSIVIK
ncbi:MAG: Ig-like domain-containing protein [Bacteroidota bacterium]